MLGHAMPVTCAYYDVSELEDPALMARGLDALPWPERREMVCRFRLARDRRLCLGAGLLAACMLRRAGATDLTLGRAGHGKPYLACHTSIHFNLSHSGTWAVCAVCDVPVGVDVETICDHGLLVARRCFQPAELDWLAQADDVALAFTRLWVRKESYLKLTGAGLSREPDSFSVLPGGMAGNPVAFVEFEVQDARICVCTHDSREVRFTSWSSSEMRQTMVT